MYEGKPLSANALLDEEDYARRCALKAAKEASRPKPVPPDAITRAELDKAFEAIGEFIGKREKELLVRIEALEARPVGVSYVGTWGPGRAYGKNDMVTKGGSVWVALRDHPGEPGKADGGWKLAVKRGRDAR